MTTLPANTPLISLSAIVLDTETTGLDTGKARIIQIGAARLEQGKLNEKATFDRLVRPGVAIPAESTAIHGIADGDVAGAQAFAAVADEFAQWSGTSLWLGYSIGFDLAVFEREAKRSEMTWEKPPALDVRHLVGVVAPNLPDHALETVAAWLGIKVRDRHRALGDAILTARVYLGLLPLLIERDIRTLADARRACRRLSQQAETEQAAGWQDIILAEDEKIKPVSALARIDSYPYRHRVRDIMHAPAAEVAAEMSVGEVLQRLMKERISSVFTAPQKAGEAYGIVTERDILRAINASPESALQRKAGEIASRPLDTVPADAFVYRAMGRMSRKGYRHLGVRDATGNIVGALTSRDLLRQRAQDAIALGDAMDQAETAQELAAIWSKLTLVAAGLVGEEVDARDCAAVISNELCALTRRACEMAERDMAAEGKGTPPVPYAMMVLGSGGRGESLLAMDQDNAIVYAEGEAGSATDAWFADLGGRVADTLHLAGVPYCQGGIMGKNPEWRMSLARWKENISDWITRRTPEDILKTDIFFDAAAVHGDSRQVDALLRHAFEIGGGSRLFLQLMSINACDVNVPLGWFGRFQLEGGRVDLKKGGIMPIFAGARVLAIRHGVRATATPARLEAAKKQESRFAELIDDVMEAHRILLDAILKQQISDIGAGVPPSNLIDPKELSSTGTERLKWALGKTASVANLLGDPVALN